MVEKKTKIIILVVLLVVSCLGVYFVSKSQTVTIPSATTKPVTTSIATPSPTTSKPVITTPAIPVITTPTTPVITTPAIITPAPTTPAPTTPAPTTPAPTTPARSPEVFQVYGCDTNNNCWYIVKKDDAEKVCATYGAQVATLDQLKNETANGAQWCSFGFVKDTTDVGFPTKITYDDGCRGINTPTEYKNSCGVGCISDATKCEDHTLWCGKSGINIWSNPSNDTHHVNCYGVKPFNSENSSKTVIDPTKFSTPNLKSLQIRPFYNRIKNIQTPDNGNEKWSRFN